MAFEEDFSVFFDPDGFAVPFTYYPKVGASVAAQGIYDDAYYAATGGEVSVSSSQPQLVYETARITPPPVYGERVSVKGKCYTVVGIQPDGTGTTILMLEEEEDGSC